MSLSSESGIVISWIVSPLCFIPKTLPEAIFNDVPLILILQLADVRNEYSRIYFFKNDRINGARRKASKKQDLQPHGVLGFHGHIQTR